MKRLLDDAKYSAWQEPLNYNTLNCNMVVLGGPKLCVILCENSSHYSTHLGRSKILSGDESDGSRRRRLSKGHLSASFVILAGTRLIKIGKTHDATGTGYLIPW
jgi:hypothetical protein